MKPANIMECSPKNDLMICSECGRMFESARSGLTGDDNGFVCTPCYQDYLCPSLEESDMELSE